jgi:hypothetical protein
MNNIILFKFYLQNKNKIKEKNLIIKSPFTEFFENKDIIDINDLKNLYNIITEKKIYPKDQYIIDGLIDLIWKNEFINYDEIEFNFKNN